MLKDSVLNNLYEESIKRYEVYRVKRDEGSINEIFDELTESGLMKDGFQLDDKKRVIDNLIKLEDTLLSELFKDDRGLKELIEELYQVYKNKRHDYGDSFNKGIERFGYISVITRMYDKVLRINTLKTKQNKVKTESLEDAYKDLFNYSVMLRVYIRSLDYIVDK